MMTTKEELFKKYSIYESHNKWESIDSRMSVEIYRIMHDGKLPPQNDNSIGYVTDFLDKVNSDMNFVVELRKRQPDDFGSLFLTAKRMVHFFSDQILINQSNG